jgi:AcrR family transcriptional regulator
MAERLTRDQQRLRNRTKLIQAAEKVFAERGIPGASLDEIAAQAGLTKGAVYSNFASKEELIEEVLRYRQDTPDITELAKLWTSGLPAEQLIDKWSAQYAEVALSGRRNIFGRVVFEFFTYAMRNPGAREKLLELFSPAVESGSHPLVPQGSQLARLPRQHVDTILMALDLGLGMLGLIDIERYPPELYGVALRLLAGLDLDESQIPPVADEKQAGNPGAAS